MDTELSGRTADTMQHVLECVRKEQPVQTRDVIAKCDGLSSRTVKRRLKDLVDVGSIRREVQNGVVLYLAA
jgi:response regulator of citrate/malate metabolism